MARGGHPGYMLSLASGTDQCSDGSGGGRRLRFHGRYGLIGTPCVSPAPGSRPRRDPVVCLAWMSSLDPLPGGSACEDAVGRPEAQVSPVSAALSLAAAAVPAPACPLPCHFKPGARLRVGNRAAPGPDLRVRLDLSARLCCAEGRQARLLSGSDGREEKERRCHVLSESGRAKGSL